MKLKRTIEQWKELDPSTMALQSKSAIAYALDDARHDILALHQNLEAGKPASGWIDVNDQLPGDTVEVLVHCPDHRHPVRYAFWNGAGWWVADWRTNEDAWVAMHDRPTHWAPMPLPPASAQRQEGGV